MENYNSPDLLRSAISGEKKKEDTITNILLWILVVIVIILVVLKGFVYATVVVSGDSMLPGLNDGDYLIGNRIYASIGKYGYGDIVTIKTGETELNGSEKQIIKRVIGLEGDVIDIRGGIVYRNGNPLNEPYLEPGTLTLPRTGATATAFPHTVGKDEVFVLGDNRGISKDSRHIDYGNIKKSQIFAVIPQWAIDNRNAIRKHSLSMNFYGCSGK